MTLRQSTNYLCATGAYHPQSAPDASPSYVTDDMWHICHMLACSQRAANTDAAVLAPPSPQRGWHEWLASRQCCTCYTDAHPSCVALAPLAIVTPWPDKPNQTSSP
eukprot:316712-Chlamydomonas_euryale.AAC.1